MKMMRNAILPLLLGCAVQAHAQQQASKQPPSAAELRDLATAHECVDAGKHAGLDYPHSVDRAVAGDPAALAALFRFTDSGWFDGAAAEGHCFILFGLLQRLGDRPFSQVLRAQKKSVRKAVVDAVSPFFKPKEFPLTYASAPH
jgi:hypothetical protein